ncbi:MAG: DUF1538 family protein [Gammaproteobacteria bacterium]|nr:DUF1538 family protein [Gammaproteobacteria bacterium]
MAVEIRFGDFVHEVTLHQKCISANRLMPSVSGDATYLAPKIQLRRLDAYRMIRPYVTVRFVEQLKAVVPLALYLVLFQLLILRQGLAESWVISAGIVAVIVGLMFFMEGLKVGLMPFGEVLGNTLPAKASLRLVLLIVFLLGIGVTFAEPAIGALRTAGQIVEVENAPYLYALLNGWAGTLVLVVGIGVGAAAIIGTLRFIYGWSLKPLIFITIIPTLLLSLYLWLDPHLNSVLGLAWDCGAVTTGPVTVPLVLALGIGIAAAAGQGQSSLSGFGIVTLASIFPILGVELLAVWLSLVTTPEAIIAEAAGVSQLTTLPMWYELSPALEIIAGLQAIVPLVIFLYLVLRVLLKERLHNPGYIAYGITLAVLGMIIFNLGLTYGLAKLGGQSGGLVPAAFTNIDAVMGSPLYGTFFGLTLAIGFAWILGFGATLAEPALNALGLTVENLTNGAFRRSLLMIAVSLGVAVGIALGVAKIVFTLDLALLLLPLYLLALLLTIFSSEEFVNIAWDSAGVTTGPITVPLVLSMGLGFGHAVAAVEGFGVLAMASICPILSVLMTGLWINWKVARKHRHYDESLQAEGVVS